MVELIEELSVVELLSAVDSVSFMGDVVLVVVLFAGKGMANALVAFVAFVGIGVTVTFELSLSDTLEDAEVIFLSMFI